MRVFPFRLIMYRKALCMSGYNVDGVPLCVLDRSVNRRSIADFCIRAVTAVPPPDVPRIGRAAKQSDARRNLYVLGLPFDLTKCVPDVASSCAALTPAVSCFVERSSRTSSRDMVLSHMQLFWLQLTMPLDVGASLS